jgi:hypothetical protein
VCLQSTPLPQRPRSPLAGVAALDKPVTYTETKIPLGELVQKVAADTGVKLTATPEVADEPVSVVVKELPARQLLEEVADLLDYQWVRCGKEAGARGEAVGGWRYEIHQDLAARQREEALRQAAYADVWKRFRQEVDRYVRMAALSQQQLDDLLDASNPPGQDGRKPSPEQPMSDATGQQEQRARLVAARALWSPIARSLAGLLGRLSPQLWSLLREKGQLIFSTDPQPGELPLPPKAGVTLRASQPVAQRPGERLVAPSPEAEERLLREWQTMAEQWTAATGYRVTFRFDDALLPTWGTLRLQAEAAPLGGAPQPTSYYHPSAQLLLNTQAADFQQPMTEDTPERRARREKDPLLSARKPFKPDLKAIRARLDPKDAPLRFTDLLPEVACIYDIQLLSDAYWSAPRLLPTDLPTDPSTALFALLDRLAEAHQRWEHDGRLVRLRSRTWFFDRQREIPLRLVRRWRELWQRYRALPLDASLQEASLTDVQLKSLNELCERDELPRELGGLFPVRHALRLYGSLAPAQRQALWSGRPLPFAQMTPRQRALFQALVQERARLRPTPVSLPDAAAAALSLTRGPTTQVTAREPSGRVTQHPVARLELRFQVDAENAETVSLALAMPS